MADEQDLEFDFDEAVQGMSAAELVEVLADEGIEVDVAAAEAIQALIIELGGLSEAVEALRAIDIRNAA